MTEQGYRLPDLLRNWPWAYRFSPAYPQAKIESNAWVESFRPFDARAQKAYNDCDFNGLGCHAYSNRNEDFVRLGCDLMNYYFVYDEYTDVVDVSVAKAMASIVISVMRNPETKSDNPHFLGEMMRSFFQKASRFANMGSPCFEHFVEANANYVNAVSEEAEDRANNHVRPVEEYLRLRRDTSAVFPSMVLIEFGLDLPNEVTQHPTLLSLTEDAVNLVCLVNDMHSYIREFSSGIGDHNVMTAIMNEHHLDLQDALNWLGIYTDGVISRFLSNLERVPSWDPDTDKRVQVYLDGLGTWVRGNDDWSYETKRYHGDAGLRIREDRILKVSQRTNVPLLNLENKKTKKTHVGNENGIAGDFSCKSAPKSQVVARN